MTHRPDVNPPAGESLSENRDHRGLYWTVRDAARHRYHVTQQTMRGWIRNGYPATKTGSRWRIYFDLDRDQLRAWEQVHNFSHFWDTRTEDAA